MLNKTMELDLNDSALGAINWTDLSETKLTAYMKACYTLNSLFENGQL